MLAKDIKMLLNKKKTTSQNMVVNHIRTSLKMNSKDQLSEYRKKYYKMKKVIARLINKVSVFRCKSRNATILGKPGFEFLIIKVE